MVFLSFFWNQDVVVFKAFAHVAQLAEHVLGKDEVISSILIMGSRYKYVIRTEKQD
jgi:hypothetical protein